MWTVGSASAWGLHIVFHASLSSLLMAGRGKAATLPAWMTAGVRFVLTARGKRVLVSRSDLLMVARSVFLLHDACARLKPSDMPVFE